MNSFGGAGAGAGAGGPGATPSPPEGEPDSAASVSSIKKRFEQMAATAKAAPPPPAPKPKLLSLSSSTSTLRSVASSARDNLNGAVLNGERESRGEGRTRDLQELGELEERDRSLGSTVRSPLFPGRRPTSPASSTRSSDSGRGTPALATPSRSVSGSVVQLDSPGVIVPSIPYSTRPPPVTTSTSSYRKAPPPPTSRKLSTSGVIGVGVGLTSARAQNGNTRPQTNSNLNEANLDSGLRDIVWETSPGGKTAFPPSNSYIDDSSSDNFDDFIRNAAAEDKESPDPTATIQLPPVKAPRPVVPPRPVVQSPAINIVNATSRTPPPLPSRSRSSTVSTSPPQIRAVPPPPSSSNSVLSTPLSTSPRNSISVGSPNASPQSGLLPPPPVRRAVPTPPPMASPSISRSNSPLLRSGPPPPPRPASSTSLPFSLAPSMSLPDLSSTPYLPPPPPARIIPHNERLAPQRPALGDRSQSGEESSDEDQDQDEAFNKAQSFPDATFANRKPPALRNRKPIQSNGQFYSFAVRGKVTITGQHHIYVWHPSHPQLGAESVGLPNGEHKIHAVEFRASENSDDARFVWGGTRDGHIFEVDAVELKVVTVRLNVHSYPIMGIYRIGHSMVTLDDSGKLLIWGTFDGKTPPQLSSTPKAQRIPDKQNFVAVIGNEIWTSSGPNTKAGSTSVAARSPQIRVYDPTGSGPFTVVPRPLTTPESAGPVGSVTASAIVPSQPHLIYLGHDNGNVSVWDRATYTCVLVQRVSQYRLTSMVGIGKYLWAGFRTGFIYVYDVDVEPWTVRKAWKAHKEAVTKITVDPTSLWTDQTLQVASAGSDMMICFWDGFMREDWLDAELNLRQAEFCAFRTIRTLQISWNIDASKPQDLVGSINNIDFLHQALTSTESPDIIAFGFQEMIDLENKSLTAKSMLLGKKKESKFADGVSGSYRLWHDKLVQAVRLSMPPECPYTVVHVGDLVGLFSCIFVKSTEQVGLRDVALTTVKTGMGGRYGNKGGILARFVIDDTSVCFINVHLAAGQAHRRQRDHDLIDILEEKSTFSELASSSPGAYAAGGGGTSVFDHEIIFLSGDLNYRIDARREVVLSAVAENNYAALLPHDQLLKGLTTDQSFRLRSFKEPQVNFAPTYKYDRGTDNYDGSAKKRIPAWCDRVLYRSDRSDKIVSLNYNRYECNVSDHRPISAAFDVKIKSIISEKRAMVWEEVENAWFSVELELLKGAMEWYKPN